jgi:hypothetical protein
LQLYGLSQEDFCVQQQAAWLSSGGEAAQQAWQLSNERLVQAMHCKADKASAAAGMHLQLCACSSAD